MYGVRVGSRQALPNKHIWFKACVVVCCGVETKFLLLYTNSNITCEFYKLKSSQIKCNSLLQLAYPYQSTLQQNSKNPVKYVEYLCTVWYALSRKRFWREMLGGLQQK